MSNPGKLVRVLIPLLPVPEHIYERATFDSLFIEGKLSEFIKMTSPLISKSSVKQHAGHSGKGFDEPLGLEHLVVVEQAAGMDKGKTLKASYYHSINPLNGTAVAAEMTHRFSSYENSFAIGSAHAVSPYTSLKTRFVDNGKMAMQCQHEWRAKSMVTLSAEYDSKAINSPLKWGLAIALKP